MIWRKQTIIRNCSVWTLADSIHPAFHVGNTGSNPAGDAQLLDFMLSFDSHP